MFNPKRLENISQKLKEAKKIQDSAASVFIIILVFSQAPVVVVH